MPEDLVLMRALRDSNMPKFVFEDVPLFRGLINDLFPGLDCPRVAFEELKVAVEEFLETNSYRHSDEDRFQLQVDKVIQMYETMQTRHTCMIVGPTGGGKSLVLDALATSMQPAFNKQVKTYVLNPKAQELHELYGVLDPVTRDWTDGVLSNLFRTMNQPLPAGKENENRWIIFDGDVDALWIENMNSVMDDNRLLTLPNGERIQLQPHCAMIMETFDLQYASPATISRCGMVFVDPKNLGYRPYYERWLKISEVNEQTRETLSELFEKYVPKCIDFVLEGVVEDEITERPVQCIPISNLNMVKQLCVLLDALIVSPKNEEMGRDDIEGLYMFSVTWSIGAALVSDSRKRFHDMLKLCANMPVPDDFYGSFYDVETNRWKGWESRVEDYVQPNPFAFAKIYVPTKENVLYLHLLANVDAREKPILFVGDPGTAKTVTIQKYLDTLDREKNLKLNINFSSRTSSLDVQNNICDSVDKRTGNIYGPPSGKNLVVFIDDLNMPKVDTYGTQAPITLLLFLLAHEGMYDRGKDLNLRKYKDMRFVAAMGPPGGGRNNVDPRFVALFNTFYLTPPSQDVLENIYASILSTFIGDRFDGGIVESCSKITTSTLEIYQTLLKVLPPTPAKFHYVFNLRDLGRVFEGLCLATPDKFDSTAKFLRLWRNELHRVFFDRLISTADNKSVHEIFTQTMKTQFPEHLAPVMQDPLVFGDFSMAASRVSEEAEDPQLYEDIQTYKDARVIFDEVLEFYNVDHKPMSLVLFEMAVEHLTRIYRIIRLPRGHALLVGVGGSGKQSLTKLATFAAGFKLFEIALARGYNEAQFREDLKGLYKMLLEGPVVFLFTDAHVLEEGFLELINNMLTTGMVPALFENDEKDMMCGSLRDEAKALGLVGTKDDLWNLFLSKCRTNLHIVLAMTPSGDTLRVRCRNFPGLISGCVIDWFFPWPEDALRNVADYFLQHESFYSDSIVTHMVHVHQSVVDISIRFREELRRHNAVTPKNYLDYISNYRKMMKEKKKAMDDAVKRLQGGSTKLAEAETAVDAMSKELAEKKVVVDAKTIDVQAMIVEIEKNQKIADQKKKDASAKQTELEEANIVINSEKAKADEALMEALPALEAAAEALDNLHKEDINEIKVFNQPPKLVESVCLCVLFLRPNGNEKESDGWAGCKKMMNDGNFLKNLKEYNKDGIKPKQIRKVKAQFRNPDLNMEKMKKTSKAGAGLLQWVIAVVKYHEVAVTVEPLRMKVRALEKQKARSEEELEETLALLEKLTKMLNELQVKFEAASSELNELVEKATVMETRLNSASKLIAGLSSEKIRWSEEIKGLEEKTSRLQGDCILGSSFLSYLGVFTFEFRRTLLEDTWGAELKQLEVPHSPNFSVQELLTSDVEIQAWVGQGLPADANSIQNGILTKNASRFPLCIDPQMQANKWIKMKEADHKLCIRTFNDPDFMKHLELAIQFGNPYLFENVTEELDPMVDPILEKNTFMQGTQRVIRLSDKVIEWDSDFRLYLTTKLSNPKYSPEVMGKTMIVNYSVTQSGLADQLLNVVVGHERPDIEIRFAETVKKMSSNTQALAELEEKLLRMLASSTGNILDNQELIQTLEVTKVKAVYIKEQLEENEMTKDEIQSARKQYYPVALRGSILFFSMSGLSNINKMYETSLASFLVVLQSALDNAKRDAVLENRLVNMIDQMTKEVYAYTCTGIFEKHKLMYSMQMTCMILEAKGELIRNELEFFLKGDTAIGDTERKNPAPEWISKNGWKDLFKLSSMSEDYSSLVHDVEKNLGLWHEWYELESPETSELPLGYNEKLSPFQRLLLMRCFRPDRVFNAVKLFISGKMGDQFVQPPVLNFKRIFNQSTNKTPIVFILSPGADPASDIKALGEELGYKNNRWRSISLGQGQGPLAKTMIDTGVSRGSWVLLQNAHLLIRWITNTLEATLEGLYGGGKVHEDFRLWITTDPTDSFPLGLLQISLKVVTEPPSGLKLNCRATLAKWDDTTLEDCEHPAYRPLVYVLAYLHAVVQERRKFGKVGWNVAYDFNESDLKVSRRLLSLYLTKAYENNDEMIPWGSIKYLVGDAMYGGRVSDDFDRRVLQTYVSEYMGDFLFDDSQKFYFSRSGHDYELPGVGNIELYRDAVETLPLIAGPAVFGLHPNAEIGYLTNSTKLMWRNLINLQPRTAGTSGGVSREDTIESTASGILKGLCDEVDTLVVKKQIGLPSPTQVVLLQELDRWNVLVKCLHTSLQDLKRALKGEIGMSDTLDAIATSLFNGTLPSLWRRYAPDSQKPLGSWMVHFKGREMQYSDWIENGEPAVIWLSGFHIPESYLAALVQAACRLKNWPLDKSVISSRVTKLTGPEQVEEKLETGCYVRGLFLEGAAWDVEKSELVPQKPKVLVQELPLLQVIPIEVAKLRVQGTFKTPVYCTSQRRNAMGVGLVFEAQLGTTAHASHWTLNGVALTLNTDN